jgi:exopolyphosphatase / guanosine-5'-triphosphate,3'-diphosphate pyrophosphatase
MQRTVAVVDIGSNTIKILVAARSADATGIDTLLARTIEARIGSGISAENPVFTPDVIERGSEAVAELVRDACKFQPERTEIVATSAARDARNREELIAAIHRKTGLTLQILTGEREAELIGAAVRLDPHLSPENYYVFDLGGGSLECLRFRDKNLEQVVSLPLGAVRLAEILLADPAAPFTANDEEAVAQEVKRVLTDSGFVFSLPSDGIAIGTGGTLTQCLAILAGEQGRKLEEMRPFLSRDDLRHLLDRIGPKPLTERLTVKNLSAGRADVFPTALATFLALLDLTAKTGLHHSLLNLRYGLAAELLAGSQ